MAISANTYFEVRNTADFNLASDLNGAGFVDGASGLDYSFTNIPANGGPQATLGATATASGTVINLGTDYTGSANDIGNIVQRNDGELFEIVGATASTWTVDRVATANPFIGRMGGAWASPGYGFSLSLESGNRIYVRYSSTAYPINSTVAGTNGKVDFPSGVALYMKGYETDRQDLVHNRPILDINYNGDYGVRMRGSQEGGQQVFDGFFVDASGTSGNWVVDGVANTRVSDSMVSNCTISGGSRGFSGYLYCVGCGTNGSDDGYVLFWGATRCIAVDGETGFSMLQGAMTLVKCVAHGCTIYGFDLNATGVESCVANNCPGDGFRASNDRCFFHQCVATHNTGNGFNITSGVATPIIRCFTHANSGGDVNPDTLPFIDITPLTSSPWVNKDTPDLRPNDTADGGELIKAMLGPGDQAKNEDVGSVQSTPTGGVGGTTEYRFLTATSV